MADSLKTTYGSNQVPANKSLAPSRCCRRLLGVSASRAVIKALVKHPRGADSAEYRLEEVREITGLIV